MCFLHSDITRAVLSSKMPVWPASLPLLLFAVLATAPIPVVRQKPLICEQYNGPLFCLKHPKGHTREPLIEVPQVSSAPVKLPAGSET